MTIHIGTIIGRLRESNNAPLSKAHLVESVINDGPVCKCGVQMEPRDGTKFGSMPGNRCLRCFPHQRI